MVREEGEIPIDSEGEARGMNVNIGNEETRSDGHGERKDSVELAETVRSLQREVQSCREDNEKMFNHLNDRLMHNLTLM